MMTQRHSPDIETPETRSDLPPPKRSRRASLRLLIAIASMAMANFPACAGFLFAQTTATLPNAPTSATALAGAAPTASDLAAQATTPGILSSYTLENGMEVLLLPIPGSGVVSMNIVFRGGADAQSNKTAGLFRMLEQVLFRGTTIAPGEPEPAGAMDALGATAMEGGVKQDRLTLSFLLPPEMVGQGLDTIAYLFSGLRLETAFSDPRTVEEARSASLAGINQAFSDPNAIFESAMARKLFVSAPWRLDAAGADYIINAATDSSLRTIAATWLVPNNAALILTGNFNPETTRPIIEKAFSSLKKAADPWKSPLAVFPKPGITRPTLMVYPDPSVSQGEAILEMRYRGPDAGSSRSPAAELWAQMASDPTSRLPQAILKGMPKWTSPSELGASYELSSHASWFSVSAKIRLDPKGNAAEAAMNFKEIVRGSEMYSMKTNASYFSLKHYEEAKESLLAKRNSAFSDPSKADAAIADGWIMGGSAWIRSWPDRIGKVSNKDIAAFADEYFMKNLEIVSVRMEPGDYAARKKSFDSYGFELITPQKAFWWR
ncbi:MAG: M16 family metallopeptidase [Spirochaetales bacterium]